MSEEKTMYMGSFEERVLGELEKVASRLAALEQRVAQPDETKATLERLLKDFSAHNADVKALFGNLDRKLEIINREMLQLKADHQGVQSRVEKLETAAASPQIIIQQHEF